MAADDKKIQIELTLGSLASRTLENNSSKLTFDEKEFTRVLQTAQHPIATAEKAMLGKELLVWEMYQQAKNTVKSSALYHLHKYYNLTENYKSEQDFNNTMSVLEHVSSIGASIVGGAITGAKVSGTPVGAAVGAVSGAIISSANQIINGFKAWDTQNINIATMNKQSAFQQVRLGLVDNGRGTEN